MKLNKTYDFLDSYVITTINSLISDKPDFDEEEFSNWMSDKGIQFKNSPSRYLQACFRKELVAGTFNKKQKQMDPVVEENQPYDTLPFVLELREIGIEVNQNTQLAIMTVVNELLNNYSVKVEEIIKLHKAIVHYLEKNSMNLTTSIYIEMLSCSSILENRNIDWKSINKRVDEETQEWEEMLKRI